MMQFKRQVPKVVEETEASVNESLLSAIGQGNLMKNLCKKD